MIRQIKNRYYKKKSTNLEFLEAQRKKSREYYERNKERIRQKYQDSKIIINIPNTKDDVYVLDFS